MKPVSRKQMVLGVRRVPHEFVDLAGPLWWSFVAEIEGFDRAGVPSQYARGTGNIVARMIGFEALLGIPAFCSANRATYSSKKT